jgi:3-hydroxybutyryl-CoA dehydrogenase
MPPPTLALVGAGTMGSGIAQIALEAGWAVHLADVDGEALERARARIFDGLLRRAARLAAGGPDDPADWAERRLARLAGHRAIADAVAEADVVIEAALEELALKQRIFAELDAVAPPASILATNTSALSVASIAEAVGAPGRVLGLHFFNPVPMLRLVEVVVAPATREDVVECATVAVERWGKTAVRCTDTPGFIVNRVNRPFTLEALRMLECGEAGIAAIDAAVRAAGYPMGPFELMDLVGIDVNLAAATAVWEGLGRPERLRPAATQARLVAAGRLGRKTGEGFYRYDGAARPTPAGEFAAHGDSPGPDLAADTIVGRIRAAIRREAELARDAGVATAAEIDRALRLGANHPAGPFEGG